MSDSNLDSIRREAARELTRQRDNALAKCARLRTALAAYRSALRSGEPETDQLRAFGDAALGETDDPGISEAELMGEQ